MKQALQSTQWWVVTERKRPGQAEARSPPAHSRDHPGQPTDRTLSSEHLWITGVRRERRQGDSRKEGTDVDHGHFHIRFLTEFLQPVKQSIVPLPWFTNGKVRPREAK